MIRKRWLFLCLAASPAFAALTVEEAVALALAHNSELTALRHGRTVAEARAKSSGLLASPEIRYSLSDMASDLNEYDRNRSNVGLRWSPPRPGSLRLAGEAARHRVREVSEDVETAEKGLAAEVRVLYHTVCLLDEQLRMAWQAVRVREKIAGAVDQQVKAGLKSILDSHAASLAVIEARSVPERLASDRRVHAMRLAFKLGRDPSEPLELAGEGDPLSFSVPAYDRAKLVALALEKRNELHAADARCADAGAGLRAAKSERYPWISYVQVNRRFERGTEPGSWGFQVGVDLPVFKWGEGATRVAEAEAERCRATRYALRARIAAEVDEVLARLQATGRELAGFRALTAGVASEQAAAAREQLAAGRADLVEPLLAEAKQLAYRQEFVSRMQEFRALEAGLEQAVGNPIR